MAAPDSNYKHWRNLCRPGDVCFVTTTIEGHVPVLAARQIAECFIGALRFYRQKQRLLLHAYVVMPEHVHFLITLALQNEMDRLMADIKRYTSREILKWCTAQRRDDWLAVFSARGRMDGEAHSVWSRSFRSVPLYDDQACLDKIAYIHNNPVRRGLVAQPGDWSWSSADLYDHPERSEELDFLDSLRQSRRPR